MFCFTLPVFVFFPAFVISFTLLVFPPRCFKSLCSLLSLPVCYFTLCVWRLAFTSCLEDLFLEFSPSFLDLCFGFSLVFDSCLLPDGFFCLFELPVSDFDPRLLHYSVSLFIFNRYPWTAPAPTLHLGSMCSLFACMHSCDANRMSVYESLN